MFLASKWNKTDVVVWNQGENSLMICVCSGREDAGGAQPERGASDRPASCGSRPQEEEELLVNPSSR